MCSTAYKKQGAPDLWPLTQQKLNIFTRVAPRTKSKGFSIGGPLFNKKSMLFTHVAPHTKRQGLLVSGPLLSKNLVFLHA
jgi:hypothetical protein